MRGTVAYTCGPGECGVEVTTEDGRVFKFTSVEYTDLLLRRLDGEDVREEWGRHEVKPA